MYTTLVYMPCTPPWYICPVHHPGYTNHATLLARTAATVTGLTGFTALTRALS